MWNVEKSIQMHNKHMNTSTKNVKFIRIRETRPLHSDLEPASLGEILDPLEWFVLLPVHVQPVHLETTDS